MKAEGLSRREFFGAVALGVAAANLEPAPPSIAEDFERMFAALEFAPPPLAPVTPCPRMMPPPTYQGTPLEWTPQLANPQRERLCFIPISTVRHAGR